MTTPHPRSSGLTHRGPATIPDPAEARSRDFTGTARRLVRRLRAQLAEQLAAAERAAAAQDAGDQRAAAAEAQRAATAAELAGEVDPDADAIEEQVKALRAAFAADLPKSPRAGAIKLQGARFEAAAQSAEGAQPAEGVAQSA